MLLEAVLSEADFDDDALTWAPALPAAATATGLPGAPPPDAPPSPPSSVLVQPPSDSLADDNSPPRGRGASFLAGMLKFVTLVTLSVVAISAASYHMLLDNGAATPIDPTPVTYQADIYLIYRSQCDTRYQADISG